jgi:hypothetical protein
MSADGPQIGPEHWGDGPVPGGTDGAEGPGSDAGAIGNGAGPGPDGPPPEPTLEVDLNGVRLPTPVLAASGCFNSGREMADLIDVGRMGGIVTKSITLGPTKGLPTPRMAETDSGMLNAIGLQNPGVIEFVAKDGPLIAQAPCPVIASIAGRSVEEYLQVTMDVRTIPNVVAIEANISCPNVERRNLVFACHANLAAEVIGAISRITSLPVFAKLTRCSAWRSMSSTGARSSARSPGACLGRRSAPSPCDASGRSHGRCRACRSSASVGSRTLATRSSS